MRDADRMAAALDGVRVEDLDGGEFAHCAGFGDVSQGRENFLARFALRNPIIHRTAVDPGLKSAGQPLARAEFGAIHASPAAFPFDKR